MQSGLRHPHRRALVPIAGLVGFSLLATLVIWGLSLADLANPALAWVGFVFFVIYALILSAIWLAGLIQTRRARAFLASDRPLVRWTYSQVEWVQMKESLWQEEKGDWKIQWGCLTFLFALVGLLTGIMLGWEDGFLEVLVNGFFGLVFGGLAGTTLGILVAGGNYLGARQSYRQTEPGQVALGVDEIYASDEYFKGDGQISYIQDVKIQRGNPSTLEFLIVFPSRPRQPSEEGWRIPVPVKWVEQVEKIMPRLAPNSKPE